jgi:tetratricopeptide (TPR) repeat protein
MAKDFDSQWKLAESYRLSDNFEMALQAYQVLEANEPIETDFWLSYAEIYRTLGQDQATIELLHKAMQLKPSNAKLHFAKSLALVRLDQKHEALEQVKIAVELLPSQSHYWYVKGALYSELNDLKAANSFEVAYSISDSPEHLYALCEAYIQYQHPQAQSCIHRLESVAPKQIVATLKAKLAQNSDSKLL